MIPQKQLAGRSQWVLLPLRLFLGVTFAYAGIQKLTDPQFFLPDAPGYIGKQIAGFATASPLHSFLLQFVVPHATLFGFLVAFGEIAIGLGTLFGLLLRPAAFFGLLLSLTFFLSATWRVYPYFYGADIVFVFCWLTLLLNGPLHTGLPTVDEALSAESIQHAAPERRARLARLLHIVLGTVEHGEQSPAVQSASATWLPRQSAAQRAREQRRSFLLGAVAGGVGILSLGGFAYALRLFSKSVGERTRLRGAAIVRSRGSDTANAASTAQVTPETATPAASTPVIAHVSAVPDNSAVSFTLPASGDPGVLVHLASGQFVAYDALCTHAGCPVSYDPDSHLLLCPCHGAAFDPARQGAAVQLPATQPLTPVTISVDSATGAITLSS